MLAKKANTNKATHWMALYTQRRLHRRRGQDGCRIRGSRNSTACGTALAVAESGHGMGQCHRLLRNVGQCRRCAYGSGHPTVPLEGAVGRWEYGCGLLRLDGCRCRCSFFRGPAAFPGEDAGRNLIFSLLFPRRIAVYHLLLPSAENRQAPFGLNRLGRHNRSGGNGVGGIVGQHRRDLSAGIARVCRQNRRFRRNRMVWLGRRRCRFGIGGWVAWIVRRQRC